MADAIVSRLGQDNQSGDAKALFYKLFTGEVLTAFQKNNVAMALHRQRNITSGKSAGFGNVGRAKGRYHTPGTEILGQKISHGETVITIDDLLIADTFIANIDEAMNHYDVRATYSTELGQALARTYDKQALRAAVTAARSSNKITGLPGGTQITLSAGYAALSAANKAIELAEAFFTARQTLAEKDNTEIPVAIVKPVDYFRLVRNKDLLDRDYGGTGSYNRAELDMVAGVRLIMSNHVPSQDDAANTTGGVTTDGDDVVAAKYAGDYSKTQIVMFTPNAIGTVNLLDMALESEYQVSRQGTLMVAKKLCGTGVLRPECAVEIKLT